MTAHVNKIYRLYIYMSLFDAVLFEINKISNFSLYKPKTKELNIYSGYVVDVTHGRHHVKIKKYGDPDKTGVTRNINGKKIPGISNHYNDLLKQFLLAGEVRGNVNKEDFELFGLSFFPWNMPKKDKQNKFIVKKARGVEYPRNPLNTQNMMTILKILVLISVVLFVGYEGYKRYM